MESLDDNTARAPLSSSSLSDAPTTETSGPDEPQWPVTRDISTSDLSSIDTPRNIISLDISIAQTEDHDTSGSTNAATSVGQGTADSRASVAIATIASPVHASPIHGSTSAPQLSGRGSALRKRSSLLAHDNGNTAGTIINIKTDLRTPSSARSQGRGRGNRSKGKARSSGRGGKRKRSADDDDDDDEDGDSDSSEVITPLATVTKSGRSIQKPSTFVPPPPSPPASKRKRPFQRRNPENAVCKVCLRGVSPAGNMIVFCDGCNSPYHRYCHKPPIDQSVIDEVDKEWHCRLCAPEPVLPAAVQPPMPTSAPIPASVAETRVADYVSAREASAEQRRLFFSALPPEVLVALLTKATSLNPDLPLFTPEFKASITADQLVLSSTEPPPPQQTASPSQAHPASTSKVQVVQTRVTMIPPSQPPTSNPFRVRESSRRGPSQPSLNYAELDDDDEEEDEEPDPDEDEDEDEAAAHELNRHPPNYPAPGQGLMRTLPSEREDPRWLVDENDAAQGVYTHFYRTVEGEQRHSAAQVAGG